jgi:elongation factor G
MERLEPVMSLQLELPASCLGPILTDLHSKRRGTVHLVAQGTDLSMQVVDAEAPLAELLGYASWLRSATQGHAACTMTPCGFRSCSAEVNTRIKK